MNEEDLEFSTWFGGTLKRRARRCRPSVSAQKLLGR